MEIFLKKWSAGRSLDAPLEKSSPYLTRKSFLFMYINAIGLVFYFLFGYEFWAPLWCSSEDRAMYSMISIDFVLIRIFIMFPMLALFSIINFIIFILSIINCVVYKNKNFTMIVIYVFILWILVFAYDMFRVYMTFS